MFLTVASGWFRFWNYHYFSWIISNTKAKDVIPDCSIWFSSYLPHQPAMNDRITGKLNHHTTTMLAPDLKWFESSCIVTNICPWFGDLANICFAQPASLIQAVACRGWYPPAVRRRSKGWTGKIPTVLWCFYFFVIISYHVSECLWYPFDS